MTERDECRQQALRHLAEVRRQRWKFTGLYGAVAAFEAFFVVMCVKWGLEGSGSLGVVQGNVHLFVCALGVALNATGAWQSVRSAREAWAMCRQMELGMAFNLRILDWLVVRGDEDEGKQ